jgi:CRP-like cAMP-binding protein
MPHDSVTALDLKVRMTGPLVSSMIAKLSVSNRLDDDDIKAILALPIRTERLAAQNAIARQGDRPVECCLLAEGFAFRSITTFDGARQILSLHIPGEIPDLQSLHLHVMDHDLTTLTPCTVGFIAHAALKAMNVARPQLAAALWRETLIDAAMFREWLVNVGRRTGPVRMAHLLSELRYRLEAIGRTRNGTFELPITQLDLGDCLGLSTVHINRVLRELTSHGLVRVERAVFHLLDKAGLERLGQFDPTYLHLDPAR